MMGFALAKKTVEDFSLLPFSLINMDSKLQNWCQEIKHNAMLIFGASRFLDPIFNYLLL